MEDNTKLIESLLGKATEYGKTSLEIVKLKALDKTSDGISSFITHSVVFILIGSFLLFLNFGLAFWLGEILGKLYYGFFIVSGFYAFVGFILHFFMHNWIKRMLNNYIIKQMFK